MNRVPKTIASVAALTAGSLALLAVTTDRVDVATKALVVNVGAFSVVVALVIIGGTR